MYRRGEKCFEGDQPYKRMFRGTTERFHGRQRWSEHHPAVGRTSKDRPREHKSRSIGRRDKVTWRRDYNYPRDNSSEKYKRRRSSEDKTSARARKSVKIQKENSATRISYTERGRAPIKVTTEKNSHTRRDTRDKTKASNKVAAKVSSASTSTEEVFVKGKSRTREKPKASNTVKGDAAEVISTSTEEVFVKEKSHTQHHKETPSTQKHEKEFEVEKQHHKISNSKGIIAADTTSSPRSISKPVRSSIREDLMLSTESEGIQEDSAEESDCAAKSPPSGILTPELSSSDSESSFEEVPSAPETPEIQEKTTVVLDGSSASKAPVTQINTEETPSTHKEKTSAPAESIKTQLASNLKKLQNTIPVPPLLKLLPDPTVRIATRPNLPPSGPTSAGKVKEKQSNKAPTEAPGAGKIVTNKLATKPSSAKVPTRAEVTFEEPTDEEVSAALLRMPDLERALFIQQRTAWKFAVVRRLSPLSTQFTLKAAPKRKTPIRFKK